MKFRSRFFLAASIACLSVLLCTTDIMAQGRGRGGSGGRRGGGGQTSPSQLLRRDDVRQELELTEEQIESLRELGQQRMGGRSREELRTEFEGLSQEERREKMQEMRKERESSMKEKMSEILLPFQVERLTELSNQMSARSGSNSLLSGALAEKLKISDDQKEKIKEKAEKLQKEFAEKVAEMRAKMQEEILGELSSTQRREYEEMMGEKFEFQDNRGERGGRGGRNRGNRPSRDGGDDA